MAETRLHDVIDALVAQAPGAAGWPDGAEVFDGYPLEQLPVTLDFLAVGIDDPGDPDRAVSAESTQTFAHAAGRARDEAGQVQCAISTVDGGGDAKVARDRAVQILSVVAALARAGATPFDLPGIRAAGITDVRINQNQTPDGAECLLVFALTYTARI
jgi:hypothetical protein